MITAYLLSACLMLHLLALILFAGTTVADYLASIFLFNSFGQSERAGVLLNISAKIPRISGIGAAVLILTGFGMMALTHGIFGEQLWFCIKFGLIILLILNTLLEGRRQGNKLRRILTVSGLILTTEVCLIRSRLNRFYLVQLFILLLIIFLSVFKLN